MTASNAARHILRRSGLRAGQRGFTLLEVLASMAIGGALLGALVPAIFQINRVSNFNITATSAALQLESAARWLAGDSRGAQNTSLADGAPAVNTLTLSWTDYGSWGTGYANPGQFTTHSVTYSLSGTDLQRNSDGNIRTVARWVTRVQFSRAGQVITADITVAPADAASYIHRSIYRVSLHPVAPVDNGVGPLYYYP